MTQPLLRFVGAFPIGDTDPLALPVKDFGPAIGYYTRVFGFSLEERDADSVVLCRDDARIGLAQNGKDPEQASMYFGVSDVESLHAELDAKGIEPSPLRIDEWNGKRFRVCFAKEPYGVCFCFGQEIKAE